MLAPPQQQSTESLATARLLAFAIPVTLLAGAYGSQIFGGLWPCEMCWWQRYAHFAALPFAIAALVSPLNAPQTRPLTLLAALAIAVSGLIGAYHAGVEWKILPGLTTCTAGGQKSLQDILNTPMIQCDQVQWDLLGVSLAGWNALFSLSGAALIFWLALRRKSA
nr:disulfide bond formation protein B [uncultured Sphingomonas sp.]